jgi:hypothetical protein
MSSGTSPSLKVRIGRNFVFMCRMSRAKALIAGPHTYTFILLRNLVVDQPSEYSVLFAYVIGVFLMYIIQLFLIHTRRNAAAGNMIWVGNKMIHKTAADITNSVYLAITTVQILHVTAMRETFLVSFILITLRVQQTLSGGKRSALFSGPLGVLVVTLLCIAALLSSEHEFNLPTGRSPFAKLDNGLQSYTVVAICVLVGASAQAHLQWVVFHEHNDTLYAWNATAVSLMTFVSHIILACVSGFVAAYHPIMIDVDMILSNSQVELLIPRLTLTMILLLLCTAPINDSSVMKSILGDGSLIICTVLIVQSHPVMGTVLIITSAVCICILTFICVYVRPDIWFQNAINAYGVTKHSEL